MTIGSCQNNAKKAFPLSATRNLQSAMAEETNRSSSGGPEERNSEPPRETEGGGNQMVEFDEKEVHKRVSEANSSDCTAEKSNSGERGKPRPSQSEALTSEGCFQSYCKESSEFLSEVPVEYSLQPLQSVEELKDEEILDHEEPLKGVPGQSAEVHTRNQSQVPEGPSKLELLPKSAKQSISSILIPSISKQELQSVDSGKSLCLAVQDKQNSPNSTPLSTPTMLKTPDGYNWRKYGQKQVKSPEGSRSYYRCTFSNCHAKKIECCDRSNRVIEMVYRSLHNHDPPQKVNCARANRSPLAIVPFNGTHEATQTGRGLNDSIASPSKESLVLSDQMPETKQQDSCGSDETTEINVKEEYVEGPEYKRRQILRQKRSSPGELGTLPKPGKKPKYVVHAAGDVGTSGDGYRWRKYGQKMVKGNPHPRNYYRCTSAGCPVRKHVERDVDNASAVVITYKGVHNHDMPVPRKRHGPKSTPLAIAAAAPVNVDDLQSAKTESHHSPTKSRLTKKVN